jgi:hypothetical protein
MPIDLQLVTQVLRTPKSQDVTNTPIVTAIILQDPSNAADLVQALEQSDTLEGFNARKILCQFEATAVAPLVARLGTAGPRARKEGLEILWALLTTEAASTVRETLTSVKNGLSVLLDDRTDLPDELPPYIERDFRGRVCDLAYIVIQTLLSARFDQSAFRAMGSDERNQEIDRFRGKDYGLTLA